MAKNNLYKIKLLIKQYNLDGFVIPSHDNFQNEYVPPHLNRLKKITNFNGSNGVAIIMVDGKSVFFTDSRYLLQAKKELCDDFVILDINAKPSCDWFDLNLPKVSTLGYDPMLHTPQNLDYYQKLGVKYNFKMQATEINLVDLIYPPKEMVIKRACKMPLKYSGRSKNSKIKHVISCMHKDAQYLLITNPEAMCWLLNIRGNDVEYTPILLCYALLSKYGNIHLFVNKAKVDFKLSNTRIYQFEDFKSFLEENVVKQDLKIQIDSLRTPVGLHNVLGKCAIALPSIIDSIKSIKNNIELDGFKRAHHEDGLALIKFMYWIFVNKGISEFEASESLLEFRKQSKDFLYPSFSTISAYGSNGAIIHYRPTKKNSALIEDDNFYLLDSGGQYSFGTTDVTRVMHLGKPTQKQKRIYTLVLKGKLSLSMAKFPKGITGVHLDVLARNYLWREGLNYGHGTGHGVGHCLSVHEGPQRISTSLKDIVPLQSGMVLSNEPGYYMEDNYGVRLENLMFVKNSQYQDFLEFENLTSVPFQANLIDYKLLNIDEIKWLDDYHFNIIKIYEQRLSPDELNWLKKYCHV